MRFLPNQFIASCLTADSWMLNVVLIAGIVILVGMLLKAGMFLLAWLLIRFPFKGTVGKIELGNDFKLEARFSVEDLSLAHKIWTELVTRKAAIPIDPENDVIHEVYNSWYVLFDRVRLHISEIPPELIRDQESTRKLVDLAVLILNKDLRAHLTKWQARYRHWYQIQQKENPDVAPQDLQKTFAGYSELINEMQEVNIQLIDFADQLKNLRDYKKIGLCGRLKNRFSRKTNTNI